MSLSPENTVYIAGPMTGIPQFNFPAFDAAADVLRQRGYTVVSPAECDDPETRAQALASPDGAPGSGSANGETWGDFLARDVKLISDHVDGIVVLPGWRGSRGACLEVFVAHLCDKPVETMDGEPVDTAAIFRDLPSKKAEGTPYLIGVGGRAGSGKNTVAALAQEEWEGVRVGFAAFADLLKISAGRLAGQEEDPIGWANEFKVRGQVIFTMTGTPNGVEAAAFTGREFFQRYGTEAHRDVFGTSFWVDALRDSLPSLRSYDVVFITDARFPNEAEAVRAMGGEMWRVERATAHGQDKHISERPLPDYLCDVVVPNDGHLDDLREWVRGAFPLALAGEPVTQG